jgi:hypothetical protein
MQNQFRAATAGALTWCLVASVVACSSDRAGRSSGVAGATGTTAGTAGASASAGSASTSAGAGGASSGGAGGASASGSSPGGNGGASAGNGTAGSSGSGGTESFEVELTPGVRVNDDMGRADQYEVALAAHADVVFAAWVDTRQGTRCAFSVSRDRGKTWGQNFTLAPASGGITGDSVLAIDEAGNLYAGCQDYSTSQIMLRVSRDSGQTWGDWQRIQAAPDKPWLGAGRDGTVFLSWLGDDSGFKRSLDHGVTWEPVISVPGVGHGTAITVGRDGVVHVPYNYNQSTLSYRRSKDWGESLEQRRDLSPMGSACFGCEPRNHPITGAGSDPSGRVLAVTWSSTMPGGDGDDDVWAVISTDGGETFGERLRVNDNEARSRQFQSWAAVDDAGTTHVIWTDLRNNGENAAYYAYLTEGSAKFSENIEVTDARGEPIGFMGDYKGIAVSGPDVMMAWCDTRNGDGDIYFARLINGARPKQKGQP